MPHLNHSSDLTSYPWKTSRVELHAFGFSLHKLESLCSVLQRQEGMIIFNGKSNNQIKVQDIGAG